MTLSARRHTGRFPQRNKFAVLLLGLLCLVNILTACQPASAPSTATPTQKAVNTKPPATKTKTPKPTPTAPRTPPALPETFQTKLLNPLDTPRTYIEDTCQYLRDKWDPNNAAPGTVVMIIMVQSVTKYKAESNDGISVKNFEKLMDNLKEQNFEAINMTQFADFMYHNAKIPWRSILIIQDRRRFGGNFNSNFRYYWNEWGWPIVNAWPTAPNTDEKLWRENIALEEEGFVDHQAYGVTDGVYLNDKSPKAVLDKEIKIPIKIFQERYGKTPIAFIWPYGSFGSKPVQAARDAGYQLGFTQNTRGPVMFNWAPLADKEDDMRPSYPPEGSINDPLMVLPRYWVSQAFRQIDKARSIGEEATAYAELNKDTELEYYDIVCASKYGNIPQAAP